MGVIDCLLHLRSMYPSLRPAEQRVATEILKRPEETVHLSITELAKRAQVSDATVVKFCKRIGYKGFQELKIRLAQNVATKQETIYGAVEPGDSMAEIRDKVFTTNIQALHDTIRTLNAEDLQTAVQKFSAARQIHFYGLGASGLVAQDAQQKFMRIGLNCLAMADSHVQTTMAALLSDVDVAVAVSYSGETWEIVESLRTAKDAGAYTIAITNFPQSKVSRFADLLLLTSSEETIFRSGALASRLAALSTVDALFIGTALAQYDYSTACIDKTRQAVADRKH